MREGSKYEQLVPPDNPCADTGQRDSAFETASQGEQPEVLWDVEISAKIPEDDT
jgi:hypothetical protein